jgi:hypothetical protein
MLTTKFRVWLQDPQIPPVWTGVRLVGWPQYINRDGIELTVEGNGSDLRQLIAERQDIFAAYLQMKPEKREEDRQKVDTQALLVMQKTLDVRDQRQVSLTQVYEGPTRDITTASWITTPAIC